MWIHFWPGPCGLKSLPALKPLSRTRSAAPDKTLAVVKLLRFLAEPPALHFTDESQRTEYEQTFEKATMHRKRRNTVARRQSS
jgi:hypothetical protein